MRFLLGADIWGPGHLREGGELCPAGVCGQPGGQHAQVHRLGAQRTGMPNQTLPYTYHIKDDRKSIN